MPPIVPWLGEDRAGRPGALLRTAGPRQTRGAALLVGGAPATFLFTPPLHVLFVVSLVLPPSTLAGLFPGWVLWVRLVNLLVGNGLMIYVGEDRPWPQPRCPRAP
jgi:glycosyltransferase XagB